MSDSSDSGPGMDGESEHDATAAALQQQGLPESAGEAGELVRVPRDPRQIAEEREREGDVDAPPEAPALELEFSSMAAAQSAQLMFQAAGRGDVGAALELTMSTESTARTYSATI